MHLPSVHSNVNELYESLNAKRPVKLGHVSLLLAILGSSAFSWTERDMGRPAFSSVRIAGELSKRWMIASFEILEYSRFTCSESLEDVQALINVAFLVYNLVVITSQA